MEMSSSGPPDKLNNLNKTDLSPHRDKDESSPVKIEAVDIHGEMSQRCVIIQKDEKGYGLIVSGDNPVFVQSVKDDGAAARAGVQQGDRIIKVNGTLVTQSNHQDVVELIKSAGSYVALTLLGKKPTGHGRTMSGTLQPLNISGSNMTGSHTIPGGKLSSPSERITGPQPVDPEKQQQLTNSRIHTIRKMLEKEVVYLENLKLEYSKTPSEKIHAEVIGAKKRVKTLEEQLFNLTGIPHDQIVPKSPKSPSSHLRHYHSEKENRHSMVSPPGGRPLIHQVSAPTLPPKPDNHAKACVTSGDIENFSDPNLLQKDVPQKSTSHATKPSLSSSLENIEKQVTCRTTTWPQVSPTHIRQNSGPDNVKKSLRHHKNAKMNASDSLYRSHSEASQHFRKSPVAEMVRGMDTNWHQKLSGSKDASPGQHESSANESPAPSPAHSPPEYAEIPGGDSVEAFEGEDPSHEEYGTPPESAHMEMNMQLVINKLGVQNPSIICMEDDEFSSDTELGHLEDHGPYNGLWKLVRHSAHLAVFMHYLMSNNNSSSLFFYLISDMYEQGTLKDMKKWAYEIHSSFLVPGAPMKVVSVDEGILHEIDDVLQNHIDKEETLRTVFRKARKKARKELNDLLAEFRNKRTIGLANIFGPPDYQLEEAMQNKSKETALIEQILFPYFDNVPDDLESMNDLQAARIYSLATILKQFGTKSPPTLHLDRCPTFVSKEKSRLRFTQRAKKVISMQGHNFLQQHYYSVTYCNHCQLIIWGVGSQGYRCQNCEMNIHKSCVKVVEEHCIGAVRNKKDKRRDRMSGIREIRENFNLIVKPRKPSQPVPAAIEKAKKLNDEANMENDVPYLSDLLHSENSHDPSERSGDSKSEQKLISDSAYALHLQNDLDRLHFSKKNAAGIGRSESFRQRRESRPSFRKRSDPNIPRSKSDVEVDEKSATNLNDSGSSSNSSLSNRSLDSPSTSSDMVHRTPSATTDSVPLNSATVNVPSPLTSTPSTANNYDDSDLDAEADPPNWQENVNWEVLRVIKPKEKKRQDVINELFHTERTHVRNLKVLDRIFYRPLLQEQLLPADFLQLLFPNLEEVIEIHCCFNKKMKTRRKEETIIGDIGSMMLEMFDGAAGEHLKKAAATFCQNHSIALESLKTRQKKDQKLAQFLSDAELHNLCRRLQLKDIIASGFQRLTKYPLLLENIAKYTAPDTQELDNLLHAVECSKRILVYVDSAIKEAENLHRLSDIQKKLEKSAFEKVEHPIVHSFKNLDITKHKLVYEGQLTWRLNKQKTVDIHVVLLEDILVLLQKQDEKYILKFHNTNLTSGREDTKIMHSPILRIQNLLIRNNASDQRSIFLISSNELHAMYEFVAATASEKKIWCRYLTEAVEVNKVKTGHTNKPQELVNDHTVVPSDEVSAEETVAAKKESLTKHEGSRNDKLSNNSLESMESVPSGQSSFDSNVESSAIAANDDNLKESNVSAAPPSSPDECSPSAQAKPQKRLQRVEILKIADGPQLIEPCEVVVNQGAVFQTAEPVLTPIERIKRKDQEIATAIQEKEKLIGDILQIPAEDVFHTPEPSEGNAGKSAQELALSAVHQANQLCLLLSECLNVPGEDFAAMHNLDGIWNDTSDIVSSDSTPKAMRKTVKVPVTSTDRLLQVSMSLNKKLTHLLAIVAEDDNERQQLRKELSSYREQVHLMHETHRNCSVRSQSPSSYSHSRPNSFISITSSMSEDVIDAPEESLLSSVLNKVIEEPDSAVKQVDSPSTPVPSDNELTSVSSSTDGQSCVSELPNPADSAPASDSSCALPSAPPSDNSCAFLPAQPSDSTCVPSAPPLSEMGLDSNPILMPPSNNVNDASSAEVSSTSAEATVTDTGDPMCF